VISKGCEKVNRRLEGDGDTSNDIID
jgi:hypothetical protein